MPAQFDVFISFKHLDSSGSPTPDSKLAASIYAYLKDHGLKPFSSEVSLAEKGTSRYKRAIDAALDECFALVAVATKAKHLESEWVRYEWDGFFNDILSGIKPDGKIFSYVDGVLPNQLPRALRQAQTIPHGKDSLPRLYQFIVGDKRTLDEQTPASSPSQAESFVFVSAAPEDMEIVELITKAFAGVGISVFEHTRAGSLQPGVDWEEQIDEKIRTCALFIPVISNTTESRQRGSYRSEWARAASFAHPFASAVVPFIIPVFAPDVELPFRSVPLSWQHIQAIRVDSEAAARSLAELALRWDGVTSGPAPNRFGEGTRGGRMRDEG